MKNVLAESLNTVTDRESFVLKERFGINDGQAKTLEQVGKKLKVSMDRVRQIEAKAITKLRHPRISRKLKEFFV